MEFDGFELRLPELPVRLCMERPLTDEELLRFCSLKDDVRMERDSKGELHIMSPSGFEANGGKSEIHFQLLSWAKRSGKGQARNSNAGFTLRDGSLRAPDAAWISDHKQMRLRLNSGRASRRSPGQDA